VAVDPIAASTSIETGHVEAVVDVDLTEPPLEPFSTDASEVVELVDT
jgi:hypothetical protein